MIITLTLLCSGWGLRSQFCRRRTRPRGRACSPSRPPWRSPPQSSPHSEELNNKLDTRCILLQHLDTTHNSHLSYDSSAHSGFSCVVKGRHIGLTSSENFKLSASSMSATSGVREYLWKIFYTIWKKLTSNIFHLLGAEKWMYEYFFSSKWNVSVFWVQLCDAYFLLEKSSACGANEYFHLSMNLLRFCFLKNQ